MTEQAQRNKKQRFSQKYATFGECPANLKALSFTVALADYKASHGNIDGFMGWWNGMFIAPYD